MIQDIPNGTALLDALKKLEGHSQAMKPHEPQCLKRTLSFIVEPPEPLHVLMRDVDHSSSSLSQGRFLPDTEIIRAMTAFVIFANETRERSQSASDALKYACQHWVFHLSRAPGQWDDMLNCVFKVAWDRHLLSWLEMQWNLKGLCHCLDVLSELKGRNLQRYFQ